MQAASKHVKLTIKKGRYVCPVCNQTTYQQADPGTNATGLLLWCRNCKSVFRVNIVDGQCSVVSRCP